MGPGKYIKYGVYACALVGLSTAMLGCGGESGNNSSGSTNSSGAEDSGEPGQVEGCTSSEGVGANIGYSWSLKKEEVTVTNKNTCDTLYVWATSTPPCTGCENKIIPIYKSIQPEDTIVVPGSVPRYDSWKPEVIYSNKSGDDFVFHPDQAGVVGDQHRRLILLDYNDEYIGQLEDFEDMFKIGPDETVRGDCYNFSWLDRDNGRYQVAPDKLERDSYCFVGNVQGFTESGDPVPLQPLLYYVTDTSQK